MFKIERASSQPVFQQIKEGLSREIEAGVWPVHAKLPAEEELARQLGVNRGTLRKALKELIGEKKLVQIHGKGTFVAAGATEERGVEGPLADSLVAFSEELMLQGIGFTTEVLGITRGVPEARIAAFLNLGMSAEAVSLLRRRSVDGAPIAWLENHVSAALCPGLESEDWTQQSLFQTLESRYKLRLAWARRTFEARLATPDLAQKLGVESGAPLFYLEQISYLEDGRAIECSDVWLRGDRFKLSSILTRDGRLTRAAGAKNPRKPKKS